jgi:hypothetical protein
MLRAVAAQHRRDARTDQIVRNADGQPLDRMLRSEEQWRAVNVGLGVQLAASIVPMWLG